MRTFAQKQSHPPQRVSANLTRSNTVIPAASHQADRILYLQRTIGNKAILRLLQAKPDTFQHRAGLAQRI